MVSRNIRRLIQINNTSNISNIQWYLPWTSTPLIQSNTMYWYSELIESSTHFHPILLRCCVAVRLSNLLLTSLSTYNSNLSRISRDNLQRCISITFSGDLDDNKLSWIPRCSAYIDISHLQVGYPWSFADVDIPLQRLPSVENFLVEGPFTYPLQLLDPLEMSLPTSLITRISSSVVGICWIH